MDVAEWDGEDDPPRPGRQPTEQAATRRDGAPADDVVAVVDGLEERFQMGLGPRLIGRRDEDERQVGSLQADPQGLVEAPAVDRDDP